MFNFIHNIIGGHVSNSNSNDDPVSLPLSEWDDEMKWEVAKRSLYRCAECETPEFRRRLYLTPTLADADTDEDTAPENREIVPVCEHCLQAAERGEEATDEHELPRPPLGRKGHLIDPDRAEYAEYRNHGEQEVTVIEDGDPTDPDDKDDYYMGEFPREMVEKRYGRPRSKIWLGNEARAGAIKAVGAEFDSLFRHVFINGTTGMGKSVLARNLFLQFLWSGYGACCIDPHEDLIDDILRTLPPHRRNDVVLMEPSNSDAKRIVGLNLLEVEQEPGEKGYKKAVDEAVGTVVAALRGGKGWGSRMGPICENISRAMILSDQQYTFVDFRKILLNEDRREQFAEKVAAEGHNEIADFTQKIAEMDQEELGSLVRKVNRWVESSLTREIVSHAESSVSFRDILNQDKIILLKNDIGNEEIEKMISTAILRRLWRAVKNRPKAERSPYFLMIDECHETLSPEMDIDEMLTGARKYKFGLILMSQYLNKIDSSEIKEAIEEICNTFITLRVQGKAAGPLAEFYGVDADTIRDIDRFQCLTTLERDGKRRGPFRIDLFAEYPWLRTRQEAREWVAKPALQQYGAERTEAVSGSRGLTEGETVESEDETDALELTDDRRAAVCKAILDEACIQDNGNGAVKVENSRDRIRAYHDAGPALEHDSQIDALIDRMPTGEDGDIERWEDENGDIWLKTTAQGKIDIFDTGTSPTSGGMKHRELLKNLYEPLTKLHGRVTLPEQPGGKMPDGWLSLSETELADVNEEALGEDAHEAVIEGFIEKRPVLSRVALGRETVADPSQAVGEDYPTEIVAGRGVAIEAERSTGNSNPFQTCLNVVQVINAGQRCLLCCRPETAEKVWETLTDPPFYSYYSDDESDEQRLYNGGDLVIRDKQILRPATARKTVWRYDTETGEYICGDSDGNVYHRFESAEAVFQDVDAYPTTRPKDADIPDHLTTVKVPFIIEWMSKDGEIPDRDMWEILVVPAGASDPGDLALYDSETIPFIELDESEEQNPAADTEQRDDESEERMSTPSDNGHDDSQTPSVADIRRSRESIRDAYNGDNDDE